MCLSFGEDTSTLKKKLKKKLPRHTRCCHVITNNEVVYSCDDCSFGESSCMCKFCFDPEKHKVHDRFCLEN